MTPLVNLAVRSAWARRFTLALMVVAVALSTFLLLATERLRHDVRQSFAQALSGTDLIVGARGSPTQLLLHSVFHLGQPTQAMGWSSVETVFALPQVAWAVPLALGDSFRGHPVVATSPDYFQRVQVGDRQSLRWAAGQAFGTGAETVLGAEVARRHGLRVGDRLTLSHGSGPIDNQPHDELPFVVSGILAPTGSPIDRSVHISLPAMQALHADWVAGVRPGAGARARSAAPQAEFTQPPPAITALLVGLHSRAAVFSVQRRIHDLRDEALSAVLPGVTLDELWQSLGIGEAALRALTALVALTSLAGLVAVMLAGLESRRRELAILRAVGAGPLSLLGLLMLESTLATLAGMVLGLLLGLLGLAGAAGPVQAEFGISLGTDGLRAGEWRLLAAVLGTGVLASLLPAWRALRLSLADGLSPRA